MVIPENGSAPVVVAGCRTPFLKSGSGFRKFTNYDLSRIALKGLVDRTGIEPREIAHVIFGCVLNEPRTSNVAREALIGANLPLAVPAHTVTMACISGGRAVAEAAESILRGADMAVAGGVECLSDIPILLKRPLRQKLVGLGRARKPLDYIRLLNGLRLKHFLPETPRVAEFSTGLTMGQSSDRLSAKWGVSREEQDRYALRSHQLAARAAESGYYAGEVLDVPVPPSFRLFSADNGIRGDSTLEKLAQLPPAFYPFGTATAGNSSFLSDGAAAVLLASQSRAAELGLKPLARVRAWVFVGCDPEEELLLGPAYAVPKVLRETGMGLDSIDVFEFHEAFAGQVLANLRALESDAFAREKLGLESRVGQIPIERLNTAGGSLSLGHPFGATGVRLLINCARRLHLEGGRFGLIASCAAGGLGHAMIIERMD